MHNSITKHFPDEQTNIPFPFWDTVTLGTNIFFLSIDTKSYTTHIMCVESSVL